MEQPTQSVEDNARDSEDSDDDDDVCGVEWEHTVDSDEEDMAVMGLDQDRIGNGKWQHMAAVVDSGAAENVLPTGVCQHIKLQPTDRSRAGVGFRGAGGERIRNHGQREFKVQMSDGKTGKSTWQVADVKRPLMSVAKMVAAGNQVHLDSKNPRVVRPRGDVIPLRKVGNVFVLDLWVNSGKSGFTRQA